MLNTICTIAGWFILAGWSLSLLWVLCLVIQGSKAEKKFLDSYLPEATEKFNSMVEDKLRERSKEAPYDDNP